MTDASSPAPAQPPTPVRRRADRGPLLAIVVAVLVGVGAVGAGAATHWYGLAAPGRSTVACPTGITLQGHGAAFPAAVVSNWAASYAATSSNTVNYASAGGAGQGITLLTNRLVDFAITDEGLNATERTALTAAVGAYYTLPVLGGAVVVSYNLPSGVPALQLTGAQIAEVYLGTITDWNDSRLVANNPGLAGVDIPITTVHRADLSGTTYVLTSFLTADSATWASTPGLGTSLSPAWPTTPREEGATGNAQMLGYLGSISGAIGYTDLYDAMAKGLPYASVQNPSADYVAPSTASTESAIRDLYNADPSGYPSITGDWSGVSWVNAPGSQDYPLATLVYLLVPQDPSRGYTATSPTAEVLVQWLDYVLTTGQGFNQTAFPFVVPPAAFIAEDRTAVSGMTFNGQAIPACR